MYVIPEPVRLPHIPFPFPLSPALSPALPPLSFHTRYDLLHFRFQISVLSAISISTTLAHLSHKNPSSKLSGGRNTEYGIRNTEYGVMKPRQRQPQGVVA